MNGNRRNAELKMTLSARDELAKAMAPTLKKLIKSGAITSNFYSEEYAPELAAQIISIAIEQLSNRPK